MYPSISISNPNFNSSSCIIVGSGVFRCWSRGNLSDCLHDRCYGRILTVWTTLWSVWKTCGLVCVAMVAGILRSTGCLVTELHHVYGVKILHWNDWTGEIYLVKGILIKSGVKGIKVPLLEPYFALHRIIIIIIIIIIWILYWVGLWLQGTTAPTKPASNMEMLSLIENTI